MFTKCANPQCPTRFDYHLGGKFYRFSQGIDAPKAEHNTHSVVHFWLCPQCAELYALDYDGMHCVLMQSIGYRARDWFALADTQQEGAAQSGQQLSAALAGPRKGARP